MVQVYSVYVLVTTRMMHCNTLQLFVYVIVAATHCTMHHNILDSATSGGVYMLQLKTHKG